MRVLIRKRAWNLIGLLFLFSILDVGYSFSQADFPKPAGFINDFAGVISNEYRSRMELIARELERKTGTEVVVVTVETTGDMDYNEYANRLYETWGIGKKGTDEGVLILNAIEDRTIRIETGYGVEGILPDGLCGEIRDRYIVPFLKNGEYGKGLLSGMLAVVSVIAEDKGVKITGEMPNVPTRRTSRKGIGGIGSLIVLILLFMLLMRGGRGGILPLLLLGMIMGPSRRSWGGSSGFGSFGGGFGGFGGGLSGGGGAGGSY